MVAILLLAHSIIELSMSIIEPCKSPILRAIYFKRIFTSSSTSLDVTLGYGGQYFLCNQNNLIILAIATIIASLDNPKSNLLSNIALLDQLNLSVFLDAPLLMPIEGLTKSTNV